LRVAFFQIADESFFQRRGTTLADDFGGNIGDQNFAGIHQRDAIAASGFIHEMGGDENRDLIVAREINHQLPEDVAGDGIHARSRLVQNQQFRFMHHRHGERQALANAERQIIRHRIEHAARLNR
jgi:hypothetical protein